MWNGTESFYRLLVYSSTVQQIPKCTVYSVHFVIYCPVHTTQCTVQYDTTVQFMVYRTVRITIIVGRAYATRLSHIHSIIAVSLNLI